MSERIIYYYNIVLKGEKEIKKISNVVHLSNFFLLLSKNLKIIGNLAYGYIFFIRAGFKNVMLFP